MGSIAKAVKFMIEIANDDSHGYDQVERNSPDYDCSSLVSTALYQAGFNISPYSWTGNMEVQLRACGFTDCKPPWKAGDIHLNSKHHVCMSINENQIAQASINENGNVTGGKTGDQTGKEIYIRNYYEYSKGWDFHLRYTGEHNHKTIEEIVDEVIAGKWGNGDSRVTALQNAGFNPNSVQTEVNKKLRKTDEKSKSDIAKEVLAGKWGNGTDRIVNLTKAGYEYKEIQNIVNQMLQR